MTYGNGSMDDGEQGQSGAQPDVTSALYGGVRTASGRLHVTHFQPVAALAPYLTRIYHFRSDDGHVQDMQPASLGQLTFLLEGTGHMTFADGHIDQAYPATLFGPSNAAVGLDFAGPLEHFGVAFSPLGFVALTGAHASSFVDRAVAANECFDAEVDNLAADFLNRHRSGNLQSDYMVEKLTGFLLARVKPVPAAHLALIERVLVWISSGLDPDVEALYAQLAVSRSTASRIIARYFGSTPKLLMRKYRALRAATLLIDPNTPPEARARVESLFYDQPHMIREFRQFTGRTPRALESEDAEILRLWLRKDNNLLPPPHSG